MARPKKTTTAKKKAEEIKEEIPTVETPTVAAVEEPAQPAWEIKDRLYYLANGRAPLIYMLKSSGIYYFDEDKGYEREIMNTRNQHTVFVDEFRGEAIKEHIVFRDGVLAVPRNKQTLQKFLSLYHPSKGRIFLEKDEVKEATNQLDDLDLELEAMNAAASMDVDMAEAILRVEAGSSVSNLSSKELRRDLLLMARRNPATFLELANDENVGLRNIAVKSVEQRIVSLSQDQRTFSWASTGRKLMTVPFDENPYSALAAWFKTDEGVEVFSTIEKRLK